MRFIETGPSVPPHLLEEQSQGNVIFFCGAGVSMPAGLDSFASLAHRTIENLNSGKARDAVAEGQTFGRVFNILVREFGREEIDRQIHSALEVGKPHTLKHHRDLLALSSGAGGSPQIVTTNFDRLFERAGRSVRPIVPPGLPDIELNQPVHGVVYLHGRLANPSKSDDVPSYVISSADFGKAYLAEGWATRFIKALREKYTIVLIGYSGDDPPIRYLLEGLKIRDGVNYNSPIYVFTDRAPSEAEEIWQDRGVTPICYVPDATHSELWSTVSKWAKAVRSPDNWTDRVLRLARSSPASVKPFERGQVVQFVSTKKGAKAFADAIPAPRAEWLCVFDPQIRFAKPRRASWEPNAPEINPKDLYGLDDDAARPLPDEKRLVPEGARNPLAWQKGDGFQPERLALHGWNARAHSQLPERLYYLARWFGARCHEPAAIWWAAGWRLNPLMQSFISDRVHGRYGEDMHSSARLIWSLQLEALDVAPEDDQMSRWFDFEKLFKKAGWTPTVARFFERCVTPHVQISRPASARPKPPTGDWSKLRIRDVVDLSVKSLDRHGQDVKFPPEAIPQVARIVRISLERTSELLDEIGDIFWHPPTLLPESNSDSFDGRKAHTFLWFKSIFLELIAYDPDQARCEFLSWSKEETRIFPKLRLWAAADNRLASATEIVELLVSLNPKAAWNTRNQRELLHLVRERWGNLSFRQRRAVEQFLQAGPPQWRGEKLSDFKQRKAAWAASNLRWLQLRGCELTDRGQRALAALKSVNPKWSDGWAEAADESLESRGGFVQEVNDFGNLDTLPLGKIVDAALARTTRPFKELKSYHPFRGLVQAHPFVALAALRAACRQGKFLAELWTDLLSEWPDDTSIRLKLFLAFSVISLGREREIELRYYAPSWLRTHLLELSLHSRETALKIFDGFLLPFLSSDPSMSESSLGATSVGGVEQKRSEVSFGKAINSPVGKLTEALWALLPSKAERLSRLEHDLASRFEVLASVPGYGAGHAVAVLTQHLRWIEYCYLDWMNLFLLPMFEVDHLLAEAAWHGLLCGEKTFSAPTWAALKEPMLAILKGETSWSLDTREREELATCLVWLSRPVKDNAPIFSIAEIRDTLTLIDNDLRGSVLLALANTLKQHGNWKSFVKPFIQNGWPRHLRYRSDESTQGFVFLAEHAGSDFEDAVQTILPLIRPVPDADLLTYRISHDRENKNVVSDHPRAALQLLNAVTSDDRAKVPFALVAAHEALTNLDPSIKDMHEYRRLKGLLD